MGEVVIPATESPDGQPRGLRRLVRNLTASNRELEAAALRSDAGEPGVVPIAGCPDRQRVRVAGTLRFVCWRPRGSAPSLEAELYDGSDAIRLVWLGRRSIPGIEPGRMVRVEGTIGVRRGERLMFNPLYELRPAAPS